jgi:hypothetical protein
MTGEIAADLVVALSKARPILSKAESMVGGKGDGKLVVFLADFVKARIAPTES